MKAILNLSFRGFYTETLNEAYIFRFADLFGGTLGLDVYELSQRAQKKGSHDLLLGRYEKGMKVARVTAPDKGPFQDTTFFNVYGPTVLATNVEIPAQDPLRSRCILVTMPEARAVYPNNSGEDSLQALKARLSAFRARHLGDPLPSVEKPIAGRLGDILQPLMCVAEWLPAEAAKALSGLVQQFEVTRRQYGAESLAGRIAQALYALRNEVGGGRLPVEKLRDHLNEGVDERYRLSPQRIGQELSAMGIDRKKTSGRMHIIFDPGIIGKIWDRFLPPGEGLPNLPVLPKPIMTGCSGGEITNRDLPVLPFRGEKVKPGQHQNTLFAPDEVTI